jgi:hypothetical protein
MCYITQPTIDAEGYKRLESGVFKLPRTSPGSRSVELRGSELAMILDGIDMAKLKRVPRYACTNESNKEEVAVKVIRSKLWHNVSVPATLPELPEDREALRELVASLLGERDQQRQRVNDLHIEMLRLQVELARYRRWYYGPRGIVVSRRANWRSSS